MATVLPIAIDRLDALDPEDRRKLLARSSTQLDEAAPVVREIAEDVRARGDAALVEWTEKLDGVRLSHLEVSAEEYEDAIRAVSPELLAAIELAIDNLQIFHGAQLHPQPAPVVQTRPGIRLWREWRPIERVGAYVPGGRAIYPSVALMNVVPAIAAGCGEIVVCSPPGRDGLIPPSILVAAQLAGATRCFKLGGAVAIAAMAYGSESVPACLKLFGAGNAYVTAAKLLVRSEVDIDLPAGPSEILVIADGMANPAWVAADLLAQSEHGAESASVLVTPSTELAEHVAAEMGRQIRSLPLGERIGEALQEYGRILVVDSLGEAVEFANEYAPEHLEVMTEEPESLLPRVLNVGSVFLGPYSPNAAGDYATGANHVHPTGGKARTYGPLSVEAFGRWIQVQHLAREGLGEIRGAVETLAHAEGLQGHARSVELRFAE